MLKCLYDQNYDCPFLFSSAKVEVINNYLVKFQVKIPTGTNFKDILNVKFRFGLPPLSRFKKVAENHIKIWN